MKMIGVRWPAATNRSPKINFAHAGHLHVSNQAGGSMDPAGSKVLIGRRKCFDGMPQ